MAKIKYSILSVCILLFQAVLFTAKAQCTDVSLKVDKTIDATCYNDGTIIVTIEAPGLDHLNLSNSQIRLIGLGGGAQNVEASTWEPVPASNPDSPTRIYRQAVKGDYQILLEVFCSTEENDTVKLEASTTATVGGTYNPSVTSGGMLTKTFTCKPSGVIRLNYSNGKAPRNIAIKESPDSYTGTKAFSGILETDYDITGLPSGSYLIETTDACNYTTRTHVTMQALEKDVPSGLYENMVTTSTLDCNTIRPFLTISPGGDYTGIWNGDNYEYCYVWNGENKPDIWTDLTTTIPSATLPGNLDYNAFCDTLPHLALTSHVRVKGCTNDEESRHTFTALCTNSPFSSVSFYAGSECETVKISVSTSSYNGGVCYPATWSIKETVSGKEMVPGGGLLNNYGSISTAANSVEYERGVSYTIKLTDNSGKEFTRTFPVPQAQGQPMNISYYSYGNGYNCEKGTYPVGTRALYFVTSSSEAIAAGTTIKYESGPQPLAMGEAGSIYEIPPGNTSAAFYPNSPNFHTITGGMNILKAGTYTFAVKGPCDEEAKIYSYPLGNYYNPDQSIEYTTELTCDGLKVTPASLLQLISAPGSTPETAPAYYRIISKPSTAVCSDTCITANESLTLPTPGTYKIGMLTADNQTQCAINSVEITYTASGLYIEPEVTSAYVCQGQDAGRIRVQATGGLAPYVYTITNTGDTPYELQSNATGVFDSVGVRNGTYNINVKDACYGKGNSAEFDFPVSMIDLLNTYIAYSNKTFCENSEIQLNCVALGKTTYTWTDSNGEFFSNDQRPTLPVNSLSPGIHTYTVTVKPEGCRAVMTESLPFEVLPLPSFSEDASLDILFCEDSGDKDLASSLGIRPSADCLDCHLRWYESEDSPEPIDGELAPHPTSEPGTTEYYVSVYNKSGACESERKRVTVTVESCRCLDMELSSNPITSVSDTLTLVLYESSHIKIYLLDKNGDPAYSRDKNGNPTGTRIPLLLDESKDTGEYLISLKELFRHNPDPLTPYLLVIETGKQKAFRYLYISKI